MATPTPVQKKHLDNLLSNAEAHTTAEQHLTLTEALAISQDNLNYVEIQGSKPKNYLRLDITESATTLYFGDTLDTWHKVEPKHFWPSIADQLTAQQEPAA